MMREIRARILALEWIQAVSAFGYLVLFIAGVSTVGFSSLMTSPSRGIPLVAFFPLKCVTSLIVFAAFLADTDVVLCLHHFGCLGWAMRWGGIYCIMHRLGVTVACVQLCEGVYPQEERGVRRVASSLRPQPLPLLCDMRAQVCGLLLGYWWLGHHRDNLWCGEYHTHR